MLQMFLIESECYFDFLHHAIYVCVSLQFTSKSEPHHTNTKLSTLHLISITYLFFHPSLESLPLLLIFRAKSNLQLTQIQHQAKSILILQRQVFALPFSFSLCVSWIFMQSIFNLSQMCMRHVKFDYMLVLNEDFHQSDENGSALWCMCDTLRVAA